MDYVSELVDAKTLCCAACVYYRDKLSLSVHEEYCLVNEKVVDLGSLFFILYFQRSCIFGYGINLSQL